MMPGGSIYPQKGSWASGGYWDADHGVTLSGSSVVSLASREGTSVLIASGTPQLTTLGGVNVIQFDTSNYLKETNARWGAFGGTHTPFIFFATWITESPIFTGGRLFTLTGGGGFRAIEIFNPGGGATYFSRYDGNEPIVAKSVSVSTRYTVVFVLYGTDLYIIDENGTSAPIADGTGNLTITDAFVNSLLGVANGKTILRRLGVKLPVTSNSLIEAQNLHTALVGLP